MKIRTKAKCVKGMTLVEVIISMFVFGVAALLMVTIVTNSMNFIRNANHVNKKVTKEAPISELQQKSNADKKTEDMKIVVSVNGNVANVKGDLYTTKDAVEDNELAKTNADIDLHFVDMDLDLKSGDGLWLDPDAEDEDE